MKEKWKECTEVQQETGVCMLQPEKWELSYLRTTTDLSDLPEQWSAMHQIHSVASFTLYLQEIVFTTEQTTAKTVINSR